MPVLALPETAINQAVASLVMPLQLMIQGMAKFIQKRMAQGYTPEAILEELIKNLIASDRETPEGKGLSRLLSAIRHFRKAEYEAALSECRAARQVWPDAAYVVHGLEALALLASRRYEEAFATYEEAYRGLQPVLTFLRDTPLTSAKAQEMERDFFQRWALVGVLEGLEGLVQSTVAGFEAGAGKIVQVLHVARGREQEGAVWAALEQVREHIQPQEQGLAEELRTFVHLLAIEDPFEGWKALGSYVLRYWPKDVSAVQAIREIRE